MIEYLKINSQQMFMDTNGLFNLQLYSLCPDVYF